MARINGVSSARAGPYVKIAYRFTRRSIGKLTGRETKKPGTRHRLGRLQRRHGLRCPRSGTVSRPQHRAVPMNLPSQYRQFSGRTQGLAPEQSRPGWLPSIPENG